MSAGISLAEFVDWSDEAAKSWRAHLAAHGELLSLPCDIGPAKTVGEFVRHIWTAELR